MILPTLIATLNLTTINAEDLGTKVCTNLQQKLNNLNANVNATPVYGASYNTLVGCDLYGSKSNLTKATNIINNRQVIQLRAGYKVNTNLDAQPTTRNTVFVFITKF